MVNMTTPALQTKNFLIELEEIFEHETSESKRLPPALSSQTPDYLVADQVYKKLSNEVIQFKQDTREILSEVHPIKNEIISQISHILSKNLGVGVDVYGSHATQLCLHWSDIDLVAIPQNVPGPNSSNSHHFGRQDSNSNSRGYQSQSHQ
jgi:DNA polymerase sigma